MKWGYVKSRIAINLVRATHWCIRGSRVPEHQISVHHPQWEDGARLNLFRLVCPGDSKPHQPTPPPYTIQTPQPPKHRWLKPAQGP